MVHRNVVELTELFPAEPEGGGREGGRRKVHSLKMLVATLLHRTIQNDMVRGHDAAEDAVACAELVKFKLAKGKAFGRNLKMVGDVPERGSDLLHQLTEDGVKLQLLMDVEERAITQWYDDVKVAKPAKGDKLDLNRRTLSLFYRPRAPEEKEIRDVVQNIHQQFYDEDNPPPLIMAVGLGEALSSVYFV